MTIVWNTWSKKKLRTELMENLLTILQFVTNRYLNIQRHSFIHNETKLGYSVKKEYVVTTQTPKHGGQKMVLLLIL